MVASSSRTRGPHGAQSIRAAGAAGLRSPKLAVSGQDVTRTIAGRDTAAPWLLRNTARYSRVPPATTVG